MDWRVTTTRSIAFCFSLATAIGCSRGDTTAGAKAPTDTLPATKMSASVEDSAKETPPGHAAARRQEPVLRAPFSPITLTDAKGARIARLVDDGTTVRIFGASDVEVARATVRPARVDVERSDGTRAASAMCRVGGFRVTDSDDREVLRLKGSRTAFKIASVHGDMRAERGVGKTPDGTEVRFAPDEKGASVTRAGKPFVVVEGADDPRALFVQALDAMPLEQRLAVLIFTTAVDCSRPSEDDEAVR